MKETAEREFSRRWLINLVNFLLGFAIQGSIIFIPLLGAQLGASNFQIGLIGAVYGASYLVSSLVSGWKSDKLGRLLFVRWGLLISSAAFAAQLLAGSVLALALVRGVVGFALGIASSAFIAYAFEAGIDMGKYSSYGSLGWIFAALGAALIGDIRLLFWVSFLVSFIAFIFSQFFQNVPSYRSSLPTRLWPVIIRSYRIYLAVFLRHLGATAVWIILPLYLAFLGLDKSWIGLLWGANFIMQFIVMRCLQQFPVYKVFAFGQSLSVLVFTAFAFAVGKPSLVAVNALMGVAWSCLYVGALVIVMQSGEERGTAGGVFQATLNSCNAIGPLLGGLIAQYWGYRGVMFFAAGLGVVGMFVALPGAGKTKTGGSGDAGAEK
jgi:MFS family permease